MYCAIVEIGLDKLGTVRSERKMWNKTSSRIICHKFLTVIFSIFLWANSEVLWRIKSIFSWLCWLHVLLLSRWVVFTGFSSVLQRKYSWEERVRTDGWDRRRSLTSALSADHLPSLLLWFTSPQYCNPYDQKSHHENNFPELHKY